MVLLLFLLLNLPVIVFGLHQSEEEEISSFLRLPIEMQSEIFSYLEKSEDLQNSRLVCSQWNNIIKKIPFYKKHSSFIQFMGEKDEEGVKNQLKHMIVHPDYINTSLIQSAYHHAKSFLRSYFTSNPLLSHPLLNTENVDDPFMHLRSLPFEMDHGIDQSQNFFKLIDINILNQETIRVIQKKRIKNLALYSKYFMGNLYIHPKFINLPLQGLYLKGYSAESLSRILPLLAPLPLKYLIIGNTGDFPQVMLTLIKTLLHDSQNHLKILMYNSPGEDLGNDLKENELINGNKLKFGIFSPKRGFAFYHFHNKKREARKKDT